MFKLFNNMLKVIEEKERKMKELIEDLDKIRKLGSKTQTLIGMEHMKKVVHKDEVYINSLIEGNCLDRVNISLKINQKLKSLLTDITTFGEISTQISPTILSLPEPELWPMFDKKFNIGDGADIRCLNFCKAGIKNKQ